MSRESDLEAWIAEMRARIEALEWRLESAFGPGEESHPLELWKEIALLRSKMEGQMDQVRETLQSQAAAISELQQALGGVSRSGLN